MKQSLCRICQRKCKDDIDRDTVVIGCKYYRKLNRRARKKWASFKMNDKSKIIPLYLTQKDITQEIETAMLSNQGERRCYSIPYNEYP